MEFHISQLAREKYAFSEKLFGYDGNVIFADFRAVQEFTQKINSVRQKEGKTEQISAAEINALGLIDEIMHAALEAYRKEKNPALNREAYLWLSNRLGSEALEETLAAFCTEFPPLSVVKGEQTVGEYLSSENPSGEQNRYDTLEEILLLWVTNRNPAAMKLAGELFDESHLVLVSSYNKLILQLIKYLDLQPKINGMTIVEYLRKPALEHPDSLFEQLEFIRGHWAEILGSFLKKLLLGLDRLREEYREHGFGGPGPAELPEIPWNTAGDPEYEAFSADADWMPRLVLMAKNVYVYLYQLSEKYGYSITKLNRIPDEELQDLAAQGFTGLWLIGLWERSEASRTIKQWCGNPEALASAYSLKRYQIAEDLGGEDAFTELREKAWRYGIRLASDMVPNHMGIDSDWVLYHPERFLSLDHSPYPAYRFNCANLSPDPNIGIRIEDHYFSREDCAVVFQRIDYRTGDVRYIYHGNDGTTMPWNDTAQLNYLDANVREIVIQTILDVARRTPIIRFDAAMTLAKKQIQRLWFPEPGSGGDIPSRAEHGMTKEDFDRIFPVEFWREVVDRVAAEAPGTLLLAEAFWLMENYFVRTLGMHRVYNSAFMNLLRDEDNTRYRMLIKNTLEFDPEILKRYVNFMNNPDEETAVAQFGKGDKYFGICVLMSTMPGLPMFGHGQLYGYSEKYGMEYKKAYKNESIDYDLLHRHEREIFPLLHQRRCFAEVRYFAFYNFANTYGNVDENVYAYSNFGDGKHNLVIYNNRYGETEGFVNYSVSYMAHQGEDKVQTTTTLSEQLGIHNEEDYYVVFFDQISGLNFIRSSKQISDEGLRMRLTAYQYRVFTDIYEVKDDANHTWRRLNETLNGDGTADINEAIQDIVLGGILRPYRGCFDGRKLRWLHSKIGQKFTAEEWEEIRNGTWNDFRALYQACCEHYGRELRGEGTVFSIYSSGIKAMLADPAVTSVPGMNRYRKRCVEISEIIHRKPILWVMLLAANEERLLTAGLSGNERLNIHEDWRLNRILEKKLRDTEWFEFSTSEQAEIIQWLYFNMDAMKRWRFETLDADLDALLDQADTRSLLKANVFEDICWYNAESAEMLCDLISLCGYYLNAFERQNSISGRVESVELFSAARETLCERMDAAAYHYDLLFSKNGEPKAE